MTSTAPSTRRLERSTPSETAIRWPTTELLLRCHRSTNLGIHSPHTRPNPSTRPRVVVPCGRGFLAIDSLTGRKLYLHQPSQECGREKAVGQRLCEMP